MFKHRICSIAFALAMSLLPVPGHALTEAQFQTLYQQSPEFREADRMLNSTWKSVNGNISKKDRQFLLQMQREWLNEGRDEMAMEYMGMGYSRSCAYAKAMRRRVKQLQVFEYNANLTDPGRIKADDAFWDEDDDQIPPNCRAR